MTAGARFNVNTTGMSAIKIEFDLRTSATASRYFQAQYSTDGTNFSNVGSTVDATGGTGATFHNNFVIDMSAIPEVEGKPNFAVRIVSAFAPSTSAYEPATTGSTYGTSGTWRFDMVQVQAVPEPGTFGLAAGAAALTLIRRRRQAR